MNTIDNFNTLEKNFVAMPRKMQFLYLKQLANYASYARTLNVLFTDTGGNGWSTNVLPFKETKQYNPNFKISDKTPIITDIWNASRLTSFHSRFDRISSKFEEDTRNHRGIYFQDIDCLFIRNGNHSTEMGKLVNNVSFGVKDNIIPVEVDTERLKNYQYYKDGFIDDSEEEHTSHLPDEPLMIYCKLVQVYIQGKN